MTFENLISQAAALKGHISLQQRANFEKNPRYLRHSLFYPLTENQDFCFKYEKISFLERFQNAFQLKEKGNSKISCDIFQATLLYEKALAQFEYFIFKEGTYKTEAEFKKRGVRDEDIDFIKVEIPLEYKEKVDTLRIMCFSNLSLCYLTQAETCAKSMKKTEFEESVSVCYSALKLCEKTSNLKLKEKVLFRRSLSYYNLYTFAQNRYEYDKLSTKKLLLKATNDVKDCLLLNSTNKAARELLKDINQLKLLKIKEKGSSFNFSSFISSKTSQKKDPKTLLKEKSDAKIKEITDEIEVYRAFAQKLIVENRQKDLEEVTNCIKSLEKRLKNEKEVMKFECFPNLKKKRKRKSTIVSFGQHFYLTFGERITDYLVLVVVLYIFLFVSTVLSSGLFS